MQAPRCCLPAARESEGRLRVITGYREEGSRRPFNGLGSDENGFNSVVFGRSVVDVIHRQERTPPSTSSTLYEPNETSDHGVSTARISVAHMALPV